jgi:hypothetical protein
MWGHPECKDHYSKRMNVIQRRMWSVIRNELEGVCLEYLAPPSIMKSRDGSFPPSPGWKREIGTPCGVMGGNDVRLSRTIYSGQEMTQHTAAWTLRYQHKWIYSEAYATNHHAFGVFWSTSWTIAIYDRKKINEWGKARKLKKKYKKAESESILLRGIQPPNADLICEKKEAPDMPNTP